MAKGSFLEEKNNPVNIKYIKIGCKIIPFGSLSLQDPGQCGLRTYLETSGKMTGN